MLRIAALLFLCIPAAGQQTWYVSVNATAPGDGSQSFPFSSLQYAIDQPQVVAGDTLIVRPGRYEENINLRGKDLILDALFDAATIDLANIGGTGFTCESGETASCRIEGFAVVEAEGTSVAGQLMGGGALIRGASPTFSDCLFDRSFADLGAGAAVIGGQPTFLDCEMYRCYAQDGGALYVDGGHVTFENGLIRRCSTTGSYGGGAFFVNGGAGTLTGVDFNENICFGTLGGGGALATAAGAGPVLLQSCRFEGNRAGSTQVGAPGGAILALGPLRCTDSEFVWNGSTTSLLVSLGGAASGGDYVGCRFERNRADSGGALHNATAETCEFIWNVSSAFPNVGRGGGAFECSLVRCRLSQNYASHMGGAAADSDLVECEVLDNRGVDGAGGLLGGTATSTRLHGNRTRSTFNASNAVAGGGALDTELVLCEVTSNFASMGGGLAGGSADRCSVIGNLSLGSGGVFGTAVESSIVWHNEPSDLAGANSFEYSNVEGPLQPGPGNLASDPLLYSTAGGDSHLRFGSPCIDAGSPLAPPDPDGSPADMGAVPFDPAFQPGPVTYCHGPIFLAGALEIPCTPTIEASGSASLSNGVTITSRGFFGVPVPAAILLVGFEPGRLLVPKRSGNQSVIGLDTVCIGGRILRAGFVPVMLPSTGTYCDASLAKELTSAELIGLGAFAGGTLHAQYWYRGPPPTSATYFSPALALPIVP